MEEDAPYSHYSGHSKSFHSDRKRLQYWLLSDRVRRESHAENCIRACDDLLNLGREDLLPIAIKRYLLLPPGLELSLRDRAYKEVDTSKLPIMSSLKSSKQYGHTVVLH